MAVKKKIQTDKGRSLWVWCSEEGTLCVSYRKPRMQKFIEVSYSGGKRSSYEYSADDDAELWFPKDRKWLAGALGITVKELRTWRKPKCIRFIGIVPV